MRVLVTIIVLFTWSFAIGQAVTSNFSVPADVCLNQNVIVENQSANAVEFSWDFCEGDLSLAPVSQTIGFFQSSFLPRDVSVLRQGDLWYGFVVTRSSNELFRLSFGTDLANPSPGVESLGTLNGALVGPEQIELATDGLNYYAYVLNGTNNELIRLSFGQDLRNEPAANTVFSGVGSVNGGMKFVNDQQNYLVFTLFAENKLQILSLGPDHNSVPSPDDLITSDIIPLLAGPGSVDLIKSGSEWYGFISGFNSRTLHRVELGADLSAPSLIFSKLTTASFGTDRPSGVRVARDAGQYILVSQLFSGGQTIYYLGNSVQSDIDSSQIYPNQTPFSGSLVLEMEKTNSKYIGLTLFPSNRVLQSFVFENDCGVSISTSSNENPPVFQYNMPGTYSMSLTTSGTDGDRSYSAREITVSASEAPSASFNWVGQCANTAIAFSPEVIDGTYTYSWSFGDGTISSQPEVDHSFPASGTYQVSLTVTGGNGCSNTEIMTIEVFEEPAPLFTLQENICTNQILTLSGNVQDNYSADVAYTWTVNGVDIGSEQISFYEFPSAGPYTVMLTASIPGCSNSISKNIVVTEGPSVSFTVNDACQGTLMQFNNTTTGSVSSYQWDFGNGTTSTLENPEIEYDEEGQYTVSLTVTNEAGCLSTYSQEVTVYALPTVQFSNELACERTETFFRDESIAANANIVSWSWDFGDPDSENNTANSQEPAHVFSAAGTYDVSLTVTTNFGCQSTAVQQVTVKESPTAAFSWDQACIEEPISFQDNSFPPSGESITSWAWDLGGNFSNNRNPTVTFDFARTYDITLSVTASNQCTATETRQLVIQDPPQIRIGVIQPCAGFPVTFVDLTETDDGPVTARSWDFAGLGLASDSVAQFTFPSQGMYTISLSLTLSSGCTFVRSQQIFIDPPPVASFTLEDSFGPPPFQVNATSTSQNAASLLWLIDGQEVGESAQLSYELEETGDYELALVASGSGGCRDTVRQIIQVADPQIDISVSGLTAEVLPQSDVVRLSFTARNLGTIDLNRLPVNVILDADYQVLQEIEVFLPADNSPVRVTLPLQLGRREPLNVCVRIPEFIQGLRDVDLENNSVCASDQLVVTYAPYPNPAQNQISLDVLSVSDQPVRVDVYNSSGSLKFSGSISTGQPGLRTLTLDTSGWAAGNYILQTVTPEGMRHYRFVIQH